MITKKQWSDFCLEIDRLKLYCDVYISLKGTKYKVSFSEGNTLRLKRDDDNWC